MELYLVKISFISKSTGHTEKEYELIKAENSKKAKERILTLYQEPEGNIEMIISVQETK